MSRQNGLDELPIASLTDEQLQNLQEAERQMNQAGDPVYLIAFAKEGRQEAE